MRTTVRGGIYNGAGDSGRSTIRFDATCGRMNVSTFSSGGNPGGGGICGAIVGV